jgi:serine/threonine protein kinase
VTGPDGGRSRSNGEGAAEPCDRVGPFRVVDTIGAGPHGVVHLAEEDDPVRRRVALKVARAGRDAAAVLARFEEQHRALDAATHPGIAKVLGAGRTRDDRPYFVLEWVPGVPVTEHCDRTRLSTRERLELFLEVCAAIQHAHAHGLVHRNLKPSNVLVTDVEGRPRPKVVELGIAEVLGRKVTGQTLYSSLGILAGAPCHVSPEQTDPAQVGVDARSDVYSLGVLLYELLAGAPPLDARRLRQAGWAEMARIVREEEPPLPSQRVTRFGATVAVEVALRRRTQPRRLARELRGDLDAIVLTALAKDPARRYPTVHELATDIRRHLHREPVSVSSPGWLARLRQAWRRRRGPDGPASPRPG